MLKSKLNTLETVLNKFSGKDGEPKDDTEKYILFSMWVMAVAEFEGAIKNLIEDYISWIKSNKKIEEVHPVLLINAFYKASEEINPIKFTGLYSKDLNKITYANFTGDKKPKNKEYSIESSFNKLGIYFEKEEKSSLRQIESITNTRNKIAHGDYESVSITKSQLLSNLEELLNIFVILENKIDINKNQQNISKNFKRKNFLSFLKKIFDKK